MSKQRKKLGGMLDDQSVDVLFIDVGDHHPQHHTQSDKRALIASTLSGQERVVSSPHPKPPKAATVLNLHALMQVYGSRYMVANPFHLAR